MNWLGTDKLVGLFRAPPEVDAVGFRPEAVTLAARPDDGGDGLELTVAVLSSRCVGAVDLVHCNWQHSGSNQTLIAATDTSECDVAAKCWMTVQKHDLLLRSGDHITSFQGLVEPPPSV